MLSLKKVLTKICERFADIVYYEKNVTASFSAGTIGTRGAQVSFANPAPSSYYIRAVTITFVSNSNQYLPIAFYNNTDNKFYVNFYRATSSAVSDASATVRIMYTKSAWGGYSLSSIFKAFTPHREVVGAC